MKIAIENQMEEKELFKDYENIVLDSINWIIYLLYRNQADMPDGSIKATIRDYLKVDFSFEGLSQDFQKQFLNALRAFRI